MKLAKFIGHFLFFYLAITLSLQAHNNDQFKLNIKEAIDEIVLDGFLDERTWQEADEASGFVQNFPDEGEPATESTKIKTTYDEHNIYIGIYAENSTGKYVVTSLRRDYDRDDNDHVAVFFNPLNDEINGLAFAVSPYNVQWEGNLFGGQWTRDVWDNKWYCETQRNEHYWTAEMAIPFKTLRFNAGEEYWKINFSRRDMSNNEISTWVPVPINFRTSALAFSGNMKWDKPKQSTGSNISLIPYAAIGESKNQEAGTPSETTIRVGGDAKIAITSSLNLDLTVYPDFSQVEVDEQQTNLQRFELFFPERRQFFLENSDLFANFGFSQIRPFFSRRVGLARDTSDNLVENRIIAGARLSGSINSKWRIGAMDIQTENDSRIGVPSRNYGVFALERNVFRRSTMGMIFVNRNDFVNQLESDTTGKVQNYNRVLGFDYNLRSANNKWMGKAFLHKSFTPEVENDDFAHAVWLRYNTRKLRIDYNHEYVGANYNAEVGFVPRSDYYRLQPEIEYRIFPKKGKVNVHSFELRNDWYFDMDLKMLDGSSRLAYDIEFKNSSRFSIASQRTYVFLRNDFDPSGTDGEVLPAGTDYTYYRGGISYRSDQRKYFTYRASVWTGGFYNGTRHYFYGAMQYRLQPYANISVEFEMNRLLFPEPYNDADLYLIGPRLDLSFTDQIFWNTFVQYNSQADNLNINSRFQWRFKPVSDLFLVYTDNYAPTQLEVTHRAIFLKITYWFTV
jgi:hypothetical protein